jgi:hypothetical protein
MDTTTPVKHGGITQTCIAYLTAETESARFAAFSALVKYCKKAVGRLYPPSEYETDDAGQRTTDWIQEWVLDFLLPYRNATVEELTQEAEKETFRFIGQKCRLDLIDCIRKAQRKKGGVRVRRVLDNTIETDEGAAEPLANFIVRPDSIDPIVWIEAHKRALQEKGIYEVCCSLAAHHLERDRQGTAKLAELWGVSVRQAQNRRREVIRRIRGELRNDPLITRPCFVVSERLPLYILGFLEMFTMAITTLYECEQTRRLVISTYLKNSTPIGWAVRGNAGVLFNPAGSPNTLGVNPDIPNVLANIGGNSMLVRGISGLGITQNLTQSTFAGQDSDTYAASQWLDGVYFLTK